MSHVNLMLFIVILVVSPLHAQDSLLSRSDIRLALDHIEKNYDRYLQKQIEIAEIPAPPFKETERGRFMAAEFKRMGLQNVQTDSVGNVLGWRRGRNDRTLVIGGLLNTRFDVIVVGVGAMGSAACYHLAKRGVRALGLERFDLPHAQGSSHGFSRQTKISIYVGTPYEPVVRRAMDLWRLLECESGQRLLHMTGYLHMSPDANWDHLQGRLSHDILDADALASRFPQFSMPPDYHGMWEPTGGLLRPELAIATHIVEAFRRGAEIHGREAVIGWEETADAVIVRTDRDTYEADQVVFCGGAWTARLVADLGIGLTVTRIPLAWVWPCKPAAFALGRLPIWEIPVTGGSYYGFPMLPDNPGFKLALDTYGEPTAADELDREPRPEDEETVRQCLKQYIPKADGPLTALRICMYTRTPDNTPIVDRHPARKRVTVACGFSGGGFKFSSAYGEGLAELALGSPTTTPINHFRFARLMG